jgi:hypothetical protein
MLSLRQYTPFSGERAVGKGKKCLFAPADPIRFGPGSQWGDGLLLIILGLLSLAGIGEADFQ